MGRRNGAPLACSRATEGTSALAQLSRFAGCSGYESRSASCVRDLTSSLRNTLRRWYSTVLALMNSRAAISRLVSPSAARRAICVSCGVRLVQRIHGPFAGTLTRRLQLERSALGERLHPKVSQQGVSGPQLFASV